MANARDLKRRIKSVKSTQQITKAMKMVSAAKLRKLQGTVEAVRPFAQKMEDIIRHVSESNAEHPFLQPREEIRRVAYVLVGSDRGLCGGYNSNLHRYMEQLIAKTEHPYGLIVIGRRAQEFCLRKGWPVDLFYSQIGDNPSFNQARLLSEKLRALYFTEEYDEIYFIYNEFVTAMSHLQRVKRLLPLNPEDQPPHDQQLLVADYILEPDPLALLAEIVPQYLDVSVYSMLQEGKASEHGARMTAMSAATDNATEIIGKLTLSLNRARQAAITTEITEIVGGAAALE